MARTKKCELCSWEGDSRGYPGHKRFVHGISNISQEINQTNSKNSQGFHKKEEVKPMAEQAYCPGCDEKKDIIRDLKAAAEKAEAAHTQALQGKTSEVESLASQIAGLKAEAEAAKKQEPPAQELPTVDDFVEHCKTCDKGHKPQLRAFMDKVMNAMSADEVKAQMKRLKIEPAPDRIILTGIGERELKR